MSPKSTTFMLTKEELFYCLRLLQLPNLPGLGEKPFGDIDNNGLENLMETTYRALISRQVLIHEPEKGFRLDKLISMTLSVCAAPEQIIATTYQHQQETAWNIHEYFAKELMVRQDIPMLGIFRFCVTPKKNVTSRLIVDIVSEAFLSNVSSEQPERISFNVSGSKFEEIRQKTRTAPDETLAMLAEMGVDHKHAENFIEIFTVPDFRLTMQSFAQSIALAETKQHVLSVAHAKGYWWLIQGDGQANGSLKVEQATSDDICSSIETVYSYMGV